MTMMSSKNIMLVVMLVVFSPMNLSTKTSLLSTQYPTNAQDVIKQNKMINKMPWNHLWFWGITLFGGCLRCEKGLLSASQTTSLLLWGNGSSHLWDFNEFQ
jgi:hypothetical protein